MIEITYQIEGDYFIPNLDFEKEKKDCIDEKLKKTALFKMNWTYE